MHCSCMRLVNQLFRTIEQMHFHREKDGLFLPINEYTLFNFVASVEVLFVLDTVTKQRSMKLKLIFLQYE